MLRKCKVSRTKPVVACDTSIIKCNRPGQSLSVYTNGQPARTWHNVAASAMDMCQTKRTRKSLSNLQACRRAHYLSSCTKIMQFRSAACKLARTPLVSQIRQLQCCTCGRVQENAVVSANGPRVQRQQSLPPVTKERATIYTCAVHNSNSEYTETPTEPGCNFAASHNPV